MIHELVMQQGSFDVPFTAEAPYDKLLETISEYDHLVVTPQRENPKLIGDAGMLATARYAGVVLEPVFEEEIRITGGGLVWHLGDDQDVGPIIKTRTSLSSSTLSASLTALLSGAIGSGTVSNTGLNTYTAIHQWETELSAIRTLMKTLGAEFRIRPDFLMDANKSTVDGAYNIVTPKVILVRKGWGSDPNLTGVPATKVVTRRNARAYINQLLLTQEELEAEGFYTLAESDSRSDTYFDGRGNALERSMVLSRPASEDIDIDQFLVTELGDRVVEDIQDLDIDQYEIINLDATKFQIGDAVYVYDPPSGFVDLTNQVPYRGQTYWPLVTRVLSMSWPLAFGMGVYHRPALATVTGDDWTDLSEWVAWESGGTA